MPAEAIRDLTDEDFDAVIGGAAVPVLVGFWAKWCTPCKSQLPIMEELAQEYGSNIAIVRVNVDEAPKTASRFKIMSIPTLILFKGGKVLEQAVGMRPRSFLTQWLHDALQ